MISYLGRRPWPNNSDIEGAQGFLRIQRIFRWALLLISLFVCTLGVIHTRVLAQAVWEPAGLRRFFIYTFIFAVADCLIFFARPTWLVPCFFVGTVLYAVAVAGAQPVCALAFFLVSSYGIGLLAFRALGITSCSGSTPFLLHGLAIVTGVAVWGFFAGLLAHTHWNVSPVYAVLLAGPSVFGCLSFVRSFRKWFPVLSSFSQQTVDYWTVALLLYTLGAQFLMALKPEVSADGIAVHLAVPLYMLHHHSWHFDVTQVSWAVMAMAIDWCFTTLTSLGGEFAAKLLPFVFLVINALLIASHCRTYLSRNPALLVAAIYVATPLVQLTTGSLFTDNVWTAFLLGAVITVTEAVRHRNLQYFPLAGLYLGAALATKLVSLAFVLPCLFWIVIACICTTPLPRTTRRAAALKTAALLILMAAPPHMTAYVKTHNPIFPFLNGIFHSPYFDTLKNFEDARFKTALSWHVPFDLTFHTSRFLEGQDGALGLTYLFVFLLPVLRPPFGLHPRNRRTPDYRRGFLCNHL